MVPQNNFTSQLNETEETIEDYVSSESFHEYENSINEDQENTRISSLISGAKSIAFEVSSYWAKKFYHAVLSPRNPRARYEQVLKTAKTYEQWAEAAKQLDQLEGKEEWKSDIKSPDYDYELLHKRWSQLKSARNTGDLSQMIFLLRTSLARNLGDMGQPKLYAYAHTGTKKMIETYINEVVKQMNIICDTKSEEISTKDKLEFFTNTRQSFGRTALLLSGGATFGLIHFGVIKCLHERKLLPRIISGASSGSIIAALICTKTDEEIPMTLKSLDSDEFNLDVFERSTEPDTWLARLQRVLKQGVLFDVDILRECMRRNIPDMTFQEAYNRTRRILNITVSSSTVYEMPQLLNYLTAPNVLIWSAVAVSCSVPLIYSSAPLMAKDKSGNEIPWNPSGHRWIDGSVENDLPMNKLSELFNVNHFIVCQVNPHVVPFLQENLIPSPVSELARRFLFLAISELQHRMNQLSELGVAQNLIYKVQSIMSQRYYGDITIVPNISYSDFLKILSNPTSGSIKEAILKGERATWPKISIIKNHCQIELTLDEIVYRLRRRLLEDAFVSRNSGFDNSENSSQTDNNVKHNRPKIQPFLSTTL
ncbi:acyl transferase/acyl hydrolase/lysophospholipase [Glomus cerebriforme]|uniref:Acyl transferase/acyl hydrolase/lysophospholipase n=1 Tax=Glomus cerebriforme TaxID=658196 RepID=A0A397TK20_9GLOM|nr:acyl transferase/acyl hydrolase/lysophospholipase [Glomus cerebriforme]